ncbi:MAG: hypothetical protein KAI75_05065 [Desulfobulbaceae bacterium]|nr:hypothetical protein [Desulfobulbaceae bacterium]
MPPADSKAQSFENEFLFVLADFAAIQERHERDFDTGKLRDIPRQRQEREMMLGRLKQYFEMIQTDSEICNNKISRNDILKKIRMLLEKEEVLCKKVTQRQSLLKGKLNSIRRGRATLSGYKSGCGKAGMPRVVSRKT